MGYIDERQRLLRRPGLGCLPGLGELTPKAVDHPPVQKLVEAGDVEIEGQDQKQQGGGSGGGKISGG